MKRLPALFMLLAMPLAVAHHSTDANFTQEIISVPGEIQEIRNMNPHAAVLIRSTNPDGGEQFWLLETLGRTTLDRQGIDIKRLNIGERVTATGRKGRRDYTLYLQKITFEDGSEFVLQP